jgi:fructan beta-fructosidase
MTIPRQLGLKKISGAYFTTMVPVSSLDKLVTKTGSYNHDALENGVQLSGPTRIEFQVSDLHSFSFVFSNSAGQSLKVGYDEEKNSFFIDRSQAGRSDFYPGFAAIHYAPRIAQANDSKIMLLLDNNSLELFADEGLTTMSEIFFPDPPYNQVQQTVSRKPLNDIKISQLSSAWKQH